MENQDEPKKKFYKRWWFWAFLVVAVIVVAAVASGPSSPQQAPSPSVQSVPPITGFGATQDAWNGAHTADTSRYSSVFATGGRILSYEMHLPDGQSVDQAKAAALKEFPSDATVLWFTQENQCSQMEVQSNALGTALADPAIGDASGTALVEFQSQLSGNDSSYDPANNNDIFFSAASYANASDAPGC